MKRLNVVTRSDIEAGFTIVELMIATLIFTVVLLVVTSGVVHFTNDYYHGVNDSTTQGVAQKAVGDITQAIQFSSTGTAATDGSQGFFCAGNKLFVYTMGTVPTSTTPGLYEMDRSGNCANASMANGIELLGPNMRLTNISVQPAGGSNVQGGPSWQVSVSVSLGDSDLLCSPSLGSGPVVGGCSKNAVNYPGSVVGNDIVCKIQNGSHFCSVATQSAVIQQRIGG